MDVNLIPGRPSDLEQLDFRITSGDLSAAKVLQDLRMGRFVTDKQFDLLLPKEVREFSEIHWTPIRVIFRAVELLVVNSKTRVLDIGSGCGKFCVVGSLIADVAFVGIEQRKALVTAAANLATACEAKRALFIHANIEEIDWSGYNAYYFYNPFCENLYPLDMAIDTSIPVLPDFYERYVNVTRKRLKLAPVGTRVVTYQGFGGSFPSSFRKIYSQDFGNRELALWIKFRAERQKPYVDLVDSGPLLPKGFFPKD